jgi:hypothetical protein
MQSRLKLLLTVFLIATPLLRAQDMPGMKMPAPTKPTAKEPTRPAAASDSMPGMSMEPAQNLIESILQHSSSGTTAEPPSVPMHMLMTHRGNWDLMLHGIGFVSDIQQHANYPRGKDKLFSTNWIMPMAMRKLGPGQITFRTMLSIEPATITHGFYPELTQQGETANGKPIIDGQHPHNFFMELAALYDLHLGEHALLSLYAAPVGDPAIGPTAYPHRQSASEDPIAALGHHQQDSTHIAFNVLTAGLTYKQLRLEGSGFHGAEPTEARWHFQPSPNGLAIDSYSTRLTWVPTANISAQYSIGHIASPEALRLGEDQRRQTASVMYNRPIGAHHDTTSMPGMDMSTPATGNWSNTLLWGQTKSLVDGSHENSYLFESLVKFRSRNYAWTRVEVAGRSSELLTPTKLAESPIGHVQAYTLGYDRDYRIARHLLAAPGAQFTLYRMPDSLASTYGRTPFAAVAFIRFRITQ